MVKHKELQLDSNIIKPPIVFLKNFHFKDIVGLNGLFHRWPGSPIDLSPCDANACHDHVNDPTTAKFGHTVMSGLLIVQLKIVNFHLHNMQCSA